MIAPAQTLADFPVPYLRCCGCIEELPRSAAAESYSTTSSKWISVECPKCHRWTPFKLEKA